MTYAIDQILYSDIPADNINSINYIDLYENGSSAEKYKNRYNGNSAIGYFNASFSANNSYILKITPVTPSSSPLNSTTFKLIAVNGTIDDETYSFFDTEVIKSYTGKDYFELDDFSEYIVFTPTRNFNFIFLCVCDSTGEIIEPGLLYSDYFNTNTITTNSSLAELVKNKKIVHVAVQAEPGTIFFLDNEAFRVGRTGIFETPDELEGILTITSIKISSEIYSDLNKSLPVITYKYCVQ